MYPSLTSQHDILQMLDELTQSRRKILQSCDTLSIQQLNDPVYPGTWNLLKNLAHLAFAEWFMLASIKSRPEPLAKDKFPKEPDHDLNSIRIALDEAQAEAIAFLKSHPESVLTENCIFGKNPQTVGGLYFHIIEHEIAHRAFILHKISKVQNKTYSE